MVGHEGDNILVVAEDILDETAQGALRADLNEDADARVVHCLETLHPLHRRGDLLFQQILDLILACRIKTTGDVGDEGQSWRSDMHPIKHLAQWRAGRGHDPRMEGVADRQLHGLVAAFLEELDGRFNGQALAADDGLAGAVDVGRDDVAVDLLEGRLDDLERSQHGGHPAIVVYLHLGHLAAASGGRFQRLGEGQDARRYQSAVLAQ